MTAPRPYASILEDGRVAVFATKVVYVLEPGEVVVLLSSCRSLWAEAIRRGKLLRRVERTERFEALSTEHPKEDDRPQDSRPRPEVAGDG